jgi:hypothetical protein
MQYVTGRVNGLSHTGGGDRAGLSPGGIDRAAPVELDSFSLEQLIASDSLNKRCAHGSVTLSRPPGQ